MRNLKKFLALVLAMMMAFSLLATANAQNPNYDYPDIEDATFTEAIDVLTGMGVFRGDNGNFKPSASIMRSEAVAVLYRLVTGDVTDSRKDLYIPAANFSDVPATAWYAGYVGFAVDAGLVKGYNGEFMPNQPVTGYEMLAMLLRAVGYGKNGEFTGSQWMVNVGAYAESLDIVKTIKSSHYANTLAKPSPREVVAELTFQTAAKVPTVTWTMLGGYNEYPTIMQTGDKNPTLGEREFDLTSSTGIVVGNQATGEDDTILGVSETIPYKEGTTDKTFTTSGYDYPGTDVGAANSLTVASGSGNNADKSKVVASGLYFDAETGLDLFGHRVKVWHDGDGHAYAVIDKANKVETVWANDLKTEQKTTDKTSIYTAITDKGFKANESISYWSDRFSQIEPLTNAGTPGSAVAKQSKVGMYRIISNSPNLKADVVISLNQEVAQITQRNTTVKGGEYIYLGKGNSKFGAELTSGKNGKLLDTLLAPGSDVTLGDIVTVNEVVGTTWTGMTGDETTDAGNKRTVANAASLATKYCLYETKKLEPAFTGTIFTYIQGTVDTTNNPVTQVTLSDSKKYDLSGITGAVEDASDTVTHLIDGALTLLDNTNTYGGVTYTFYADELGRFIGVSIPSDYTFLYGTYADYTMGELGSADLKYYVSGFDWDGKLVANHALTSLDKGSMNGARYNGLKVARKDLGNANATDSKGGNQIAAGYNKGYMINEKGDLQDENGTVAIRGTRFTGTTTGVDATNATELESWEITSQNAANGFARVKAAGVDYLLTNDTQFIVISGVGINATVTVYNGLKELVGTGSSVEISGDSYDTVNNAPVHCDEVWFLTGDKQYGNVDTSKNNTITTVIMSEDNLVNYGLQTLYFSAPGNSATGVKLAGDHGGFGTVSQYKLYNNGVASYYWVSDALSVDKTGNSAVITGTAQTGDFYNLIQIGTMSGQPIYKAIQVTDNYGNHVGATYKYVVVNDVQTAEIKCGSHSSFDSVYKVGGAVVAEAYGNNTPSTTLFPNGTTGINDLLTLNNAVSMGKDNASGNFYTVSVAVIYTGIEVSCIYVTGIAAG